MTLQFIGIILLLLLIAGIWLLVNEFRRRRWLKLHFLEIIDQIRSANTHFEQFTNFERYFANRDEQLFLDKYRPIRRAINMSFERIGLTGNQVEAFRKFCDNFDHSAIIRRIYNEQFVPREALKYSDFFAGLEDYPLSDDQIKAIIRDEDNNLVIAGAGTGKTTTISGKVAYLLEKGIARADELLVISFTKNAVQEMYDRCMKFCAHIPAAEHLDVRTFNSFGFLVSRSCSPREILLAFNGQDDDACVFLQQKFDDLFKTDSDFQRKAINFLAFFSRPERDEFDFPNRHAYLNHERSFDNRTLDGLKVNSKEEMEIGNFFCLFGVNYEYERHFPLQDEDRTAERGAYRPDFYLPDYEIWHEHFGITRDGDVPRWFTTRPPFKSAREYYHAGIVWKEQIHEKYQTRLIKTYSFENKEGVLISNLKKKLIEYGVELRQRSPEELLDLIKKSDLYEEFIGLIHTFLGLMKSNGKSPSELVPKKDKKRFKVFMDIFKPLFTAYEWHLHQQSAIDYSDMINRASLHIRSGDFTKPYKYILVDEFQDMSLGRYELLKAIRQQNPDVKLYAVGDDWQSIFRFTGSDISIITKFDKQFGTTCQTEILKTYRFNEQILQASSTFIQQNPSQIHKELTVNQPAPEGHTSFEFIKIPSVNGGAEKYQQIKSSILIELLENIVATKPDATIYFIGRYRFNVPKDLKGLQRAFPGLTLSYYTAHRVKGMTCDYAILLDVDSGTLGFPSEIADDPLLSCLLHEGDEFENAEERRVFYVAITRARYKNYLIYTESRPSKFLTELQEATGFAQLNVVKKCPECCGPMILRKGPYSDFYGCVNYPQCDGKISVSVPPVTVVKEV